MPVNQPEYTFFQDLANKSAQSNSQSKEPTLDESRLGVASIFALTRSVTDAPYLDETISARDGYSLPIRIYNHNLPKETPVFVYYMGNGYIYNLFETNASVCSRIAKASSIKVVIVNSRLAPEDPLPTSIYDSYDAAKFIALEADNINIKTDKILLGGFCSGAACAVSVANLASDLKEFKINHLVLLNGLYDFSTRHAQYQDFEKEDISLTEELKEFVLRNQKIPAADLADPIYSPFNHNHLNRLPSTTLIVAEYDRNRSSSEAFYEKLISNNVAVEKVILNGQMHNTVIFNIAGLDPAITMAEAISQHCAIS